MCAEANSQHEKSKQNFKVLLLLSFFSTWMKLFHFKLAYLHEFLEYQNIHVIALEKVLLDPIFMILKCDFFYSLWIVFLKTSRRFDLSSRSRGHVMFLLRELLRKQELVVDPQWTKRKVKEAIYINNNNGRNGSCLTWLATSWRKGADGL